MNKDQLNLICVDDDEFMLKALARLIRRLRPEWGAFFYSDPLTWQEQWKSDSNDLPAIFISDMLMPKKRGDELLEDIKYIFPQSVRVLLTGDTTQGLSQKAHDFAHYVIPKPFTQDDFEHLFTSAERLYKLPFNHECRARLGGFTSLPVLPNTVIDLRETIASPEGDINAIANVVSHEPALVARIFQLANSPFLGFRRHTDSLAEAVSRLGATLVETLAVSLLLKIPGDRVPESVHRKIAEEALALGSVARMLAKALGRSLHEQDKVFVASLLTSIGSLVLLEEGVEQSDLSHCYGLEEKYDDDHVVAAYVLILWGYDIELGEIILNQNTVNFSSDQHIVELASIVGAASYLKQCQTQLERDTFIENQPISVQDALNEIVLTLLDEVTH